MKILFVIPSLKNSGPVNVVINLIKSLDLNHDISVLAFSNGDLHDEFLKYTNNVKIIPMHHLWEMSLFFADHAFDIIHSHCLVPDLIASLYSDGGAKTISTIHNYIDDDYVLSKGWFLGKLMGVAHRIALNKVSYKFGCSNSVAVYVRNKYNLLNVDYVRNGVLDKTVATYDYKNKIKEDGVIRFYYLGVINKRKNISVILEAFKVFSLESRRKVELHIIGDGVDYSFLSKKYALSNIFFHGEVSNPESLYVDFDVFVSASKAEGLPLAMIESLSLSKSYICSNIEPHCEIHNIAQSGLIVDNVIEQFYEAFNKIDRNFLADNAIKARCAYLKHFSAKNMASMYQEKYSMLLGEKHDK